MIFRSYHRRLRVRPGGLGVSAAKLHASPVSPRGRSVVSPLAGARPLQEHDICLEQDLSSPPSRRFLRREDQPQVLPSDSSSYLSVPQVYKAAQQEIRPGGPPEKPLPLQFVQVQPWTWVLRKWTATRPQGSRVARLRADLVEYAIPI